MDLVIQQMERLVMNEAATHKGAKRSKPRPVEVLPVLLNTPGDLFWEMNKPGTAFEQNVVGIVVVRADGTIAYINAYFARLIGDLPTDMVGKPILDFVPQRDKATVAEVVKDCISGKRRFVQFESTITHKNGNTVDIFVNASAAIFEGQPAAIGAVIDITARKQMEAVARRLRVETSDRTDEHVAGTCDARCKGRAGDVSPSPKCTCCLTTRSDGHGRSGTLALGSDSGVRIWTPRARSLRWRKSSVAVEGGHLCPRNLRRRTGALLRTYRPMPDGGYS